MWGDSESVARRCLSQATSGNSMRQHNFARLLVIQRKSEKGFRSSDQRVLLRAVVPLLIPLLIVIRYFARRLRTWRGHWSRNSPDLTRGVAAHHSRALNSSLIYCLTSSGTRGVGQLPTCRMLCHMRPACSCRTKARASRQGRIACGNVRRPIYWREISKNPYIRVFSISEDKYRRIFMMLIPNHPYDVG